jgi:hypothetical protein
MAPRKYDFCLELHLQKKRETKTVENVAGNGRKPL